MKSDTSTRAPPFPLRRSSRPAHSCSIHTTPCGVKALVVYTRSSILHIFPSPRAPESREDKPREDLTLRLQLLRTPDTLFRYEENPLSKRVFPISPQTASQTRRQSLAHAQHHAWQLRGSSHTPKPLSQRPLSRHTSKSSTLPHCPTPCRKRREHFEDFAIMSTSSRKRIGQEARKLPQFPTRTIDVRQTNVRQALHTQEIMRRDKPSPL